MKNKTLFLTLMTVTFTIAAHAQVWQYPSPGNAYFAGSVSTGPITADGILALTLKRTGAAYNSGIIRFENMNGPVGFFGVRENNIIALSSSGDLISGGGNLVTFNTSTLATTFTGAVSSGPITADGLPALTLKRTGAANNSGIIRFENTNGPVGFLGIRENNVISLSSSNDLVSGGPTVVNFNTNTRETAFGGKVTIGDFINFSPINKYLLNVDGPARANEVVVNVTGGADFVFENEYKPMPLQEVERFITQHKHLPEIPSAEEMVKEGVEVGAMEIKLLQKIEELTLYVIELKKEVDQLKSEKK